MLRLVPDASLDENEAAMIEAIEEVHTGEITVSTRSVEIDGVNVEKGEVIALFDGNCGISADDGRSAAKALYRGRSRAL